MAKFNYDNTVAVSTTLIEKFGNPITQTRGYDEAVWSRQYIPSTESFVWTNSSTGATQETEPSDDVNIANGVLVGIEDSLLSNSLIKKSDSMLLTIGIDEPQVGDVFRVSGKDYNYVTHITVNPAGTVCLFKIVLRV